MDPSPLTRGKLTLTHSLPLPHWLIPAHAGKTTNARPANQSPPAHPRSRGENFSSCADLLSASGSSPLTRGKRLADLRDGLNLRLIPAHAGKTTGSPPGSKTPAAHPPPHAGKTHDTHVTPPARRAHPRSRGENLLHTWCLDLRLGSSPLTRGKPPLRPLAHRRIRLIPAHAGKTARKRLDVGAGGAHPRSRGENWSPSRKITAAFGSSPLTRGKLFS